jgi:hypothetical protein
MWDMIAPYQHVSKNVCTVTVLYRINAHVKKDGVDMIAQYLCAHKNATISVFAQRLTLALVLNGRINGATAAINHYIRPQMVVRN